ncbi:MAG: hypothetical protein ABJA82_06270 [Myxococcales bacterium]
MPQSWVIPHTSHAFRSPAVHAQAPQSVPPLLQVPEGQLVKVGGEHDPLPAQVPAEVRVPPLQVWSRQLPTGKKQVVRTVPSQRPAHAPEPVHGVRGVFTATHAPALLQASHCPVQVVLQQTRSQKPL